MREILVGIGGILVQTGGIMILTGGFLVQTSGIMFRIGGIIIILNCHPRTRAPALTSNTHTHLPLERFLLLKLA
ncbi:hypothetical protein [Neobacillus cucumis]|uniref:hypothetical protein n=1 Tax=Neobacillus cucumis TaxID=1740721 RepID=UPI001966131F|nr:hypothetical protein [Neobacillus cucumis]MBM7653986.1 hypothetical protein [Neobacillus cucumis]